MRHIDINLENNEFDNFLSKGKVGGMLKGVIGQVVACQKEISDKNPKYGKTKLKGLGKSDKAKFQALMKSCMKSKKKKPPKIRHKRVGATEYQKMRENQMSEKQINKFKRAEAKRNELALQRKQEELQKAPPEAPPPPPQQEGKGKGKYKNLIIGGIALVVIIVGIKLFK